MRVGAPLLELADDDKHEKKFIPIVFSHGVGCTVSWFSTICKDLASQGFIVFCIEHKDSTALYYKDEYEHDKYYKNLDMSNLNSIIKKLGIRIKELDRLISEINFISKNSLGEKA